MSDSKPSSVAADQLEPLAAPDSQHEHAARWSRTAPMALASPAPDVLRRQSRLSLRLLHWLLTPGAWTGRGATAAARLRGWARVLNWYAASTPSQRLRLIRRAIWTPVRVWGEAGEAINRFGADVEATAGIPPNVQRRQLWWLGVHHGINATSYLNWQLYRPERRRHAAGYMQGPEFYRVGWWLNFHLRRTDGYPVSDKLRFPAWCSRNGLPAIPTLLEYEHGALAVSTLAGEPAESLPSCSLFSKPSDDSGGHGAERWRYVGAQDGTRGWMGRDGRVRSATELLSELAEMSQTMRLGYNADASRRILLQRCISNHRDLLPLTPGGLCTIRVVTYRLPGEGAHVLHAIYKMPTGDSVADNFHFGGIIAPVDVATGRLGPAIRRQGRITVPIERHPDTGATINGHQIPYWAETVALARTALDAAHDRPSIGWDITITDDGPILVEGNSISAPSLSQEPTGIPLSDTPFPAAIEAHVRACMGL